ncbi:Copper-transporting ATPase 1 (Fragment) [Seminavis robusta]|uniref:Copper-transporting ATPase 1 n=1 Tax=Seminavis robusta TaxID=568900 RepID=A0A9N8HRN0_9STRA
MAKKKKRGKKDKINPVSQRQQESEQQQPPPEQTAASSTQQTDSSSCCGDVASTITDLVESTAEVTTTSSFCDLFVNKEEEGNTTAETMPAADPNPQTKKQYGNGESFNSILASPNSNQINATAKSVTTGTNSSEETKNECGVEENDKEQTEEEPKAASPQKSCCSSQNKKDGEEDKQAAMSETNNHPENQDSTPVKTQEDVALKSPPKSPPKPAGSCCASKAKKTPTVSSLVSSTPMIISTPTTTCCGCGDDCRCCRENGWSYCQCGPNCRCSNPLMTEQASLLLECTNQQLQQQNNNASTRAAFASASTDSTAIMSVDDPLKAPPTMDSAIPDDLEANHQQQQKTPPLFVDIVVGGMTCTMCSQAITRAMKNTNGVSGVKVSLSTDIAHIEFDPSRNYAEMVEQVEETISDIGYMVVDVIKMPNQELLPAPSTTGDAAGGNNNPWLESNNAPVSNGSNGGESPSSGNTQQDRWNRIAQRQEEKVQERKRAFLWSLVGTTPIILLTMVLPHVLPTASVQWWDRQHIHLFGITMPLESLLLFVLATPVQFICGLDFYKGTYYGFFRSGTLNMDVLVCLGSTASWGYALYATLCNQEQESHFFETSAVLICFVLLGKWMQAVAVHRTSDALSHLMQLQPSTAIRVVPVEATKNGDGITWDPMTEAYREEVVPTDQLQRGDFVKIVPGASLPADGVVLAGELAVDESMVTGESLPVLKTKSSVVLGGTVCVESSTTTTGETTVRETTEQADAENPSTKAGQVAFCEVTGVGSSTALAQIIQLVQDAQASKVPMQNFADTVSSVFVPVVATLSLITFLVWYALCSSGVVPEEWYSRLDEDAATFSLMFGIATLVISCPCALGLAVPTAIMVGTGVGAKLGVLMKGGEAFEAASQVSAVVLDKTGTVTTGKPAVTDFLLLQKSGNAGEDGCGNAQRKSPPSLLDEKPLSKETILWLLGSLERSSEHPLAKAIVSHAEEVLSQSIKGPAYLEKNPFLQPSEFRSMTGRGASGYLTIPGRDDKRYFVAVGNRAFFATLDIELTMEIDNQMKELEEQGKTAILAAVNYEFTVLLGVADELKPDAAAAVAYLRNEMKIDVWMVTGDNARTAQAIARQLNLPPQRVVSEALPNAKVYQVKKLQQQGKIVAHVGDGINDSPALAQANVGISMGTGAAIAAEASDMVLVRGQYVADVCIALDLCRSIFARIQWNLVWSLIYNCLGIPLAAGVSFPLLHARLPPTVAALAMALSSVSVVFSSLALRLYKPPVIACRSTRPAAGIGSTPSGDAVGAVTRSNQPHEEPAALNPRRGQLVTRLSLEEGNSSCVAELTEPLLSSDRLEAGTQKGDST